MITVSKIVKRLNSYVIYLKTLIFRNIQQDQRREIWDQTKIILANEIKKKMENINHSVIMKKIERPHRAKEYKPGRDLPVIAKFTECNFSKEVKASFMKAAKVGTAQCNEAMKKWEKLGGKDQVSRAFVKYPSVLVIKRPAEAAYTPYAEY